MSAAGTIGSAALAVKSFPAVKHEIGYYMAKYQCKTQSAIPTDEGATTATAKSAGGRLGNSATRQQNKAIAAWIIVYISLWLSRDNLVSSKFSKNNCHTGFVSRIIETMIFPFQWYKNRPTYEYVVGLVLLCCISVVAVIKCFSVFSSIEQPMIEAIFEHCNFTFISTVCAVCGYYCLIVDVPHFEKIIYRSAAVIFIGFAIVSFAFPFVF